MRCSPTCHLESNSSAEKHCSELGILLRHFDEREWSYAGKIIFYLFGMLWTLVGVAVGTDVFVSAVERIISKKRIKMLPDGGKVEEHVWNPTVANLTLMALGSSLPEISLATVEIIGNKFCSGDLGPSTIVGSAGFTRLCITAICIVSVPHGRTRKIAQGRVFIVTTLFTILAYLWLLYILMGNSRDQVEVWEALFTLFLFFTLVFVAYIVDKHCCCSKKKVQIRDSNIEGTKLAKVDSRGYLAGWNKFKYGNLERELAVQHRDLTADGIAQLVAEEAEKQKQHSMAYYRLRSGWLAKKLRPEKAEDRLESEEKVEAHMRRPGCVSEDLDIGTAVIEFSARKFAALESEKMATISIVRTGNVNQQSSVYCETLDGTAAEGADYVKFAEVLHFMPGQHKLSVQIEVVDDDEVEPDEVFYMRLDLVDYEDKSVVLGNDYIAEVTIVSDEIKRDRIVEFEKTAVLVEETAGVVAIPVTREGCYSERLKVTWKTTDLTAVSGENYFGGAGEVLFEPGEVRKVVQLPIVDKLDLGCYSSFEISLIEVTEGFAEIGWSSRATVTIISNRRVAEWFAKSDVLVDQYMAEIEAAGAPSWKAQFRRALNVNDGDIAGASIQDYFYHMISFGWKLLFAFVPPTYMLGGWLCFFVSLALIALQTAIVKDMAAIFGCYVGIKDSITAITFVAVGASLPDLFASRTAAIQDKTADNAIGHINGGNAINVFLGVGFPWSIASIYWATQGYGFCVEAGSLAFEVGVFCIGVGVAVGLLMVRRFSRFFGRAELGGPTFQKVLSAVLLIMVWFAYVALSYLQAYDYIDDLSGN